MLSRKQIELFIELSNYCDSYVKAKKLAEHFNVSIRTIYKELDMLKKNIDSPSLVISSVASKGYRMEVLNKKQFDKYREFLMNTYYNYRFFEEQSSRVNYILTRLFSTVKRFIAYEVLEKELYISKSRLLSDIKVTRDVLLKYKLSLPYKSGRGLSIEGTEVNKRLCIAKENININVFNYRDDCLIQEIKKMMSSIFI